MEQKRELVADGLKRSTSQDIRHSNDERAADFPRTQERGYKYVANLNFFTPLHSIKPLHSKVLLGIRCMRNFSQAAVLTALCCSGVLGTL